MTTAFGRHRRGAAIARAGPPSAGQHQGATEMRASVSTCSWRAFTLKAAMVPPDQGIADCVMQALSAFEAGAGGSRAEVCDPP
jgi:hypothetical protein